MVWRYSWPGLVPMPAGSRVVHVDVPTQQLWALCEPEADLVVWQLGIYGTGEPLPSGAEYLATWLEPQANTRALVWHLVRHPPEEAA